MFVDYLRTYCIVGYFVSVKKEFLEIIEFVFCIM